MNLSPAFFLAGALVFSSCSSQPLGGADPLDGPPASTMLARDHATSPDHHLDQRFHEESLRQAEAEGSGHSVRGSAGVSARAEW